MQQAESLVTIADVCRKLGISEATFYSWKKKFSALGPVELRRLRQLEEENAVDVGILFVKDLLG